MKIYKRKKSYVRKGRIVKHHRQRYVKKASIPLSQAKYVTLYHGTSREHAERIKKEGLIPQPGKTLRNWNEPEVGSGSSWKVDEAKKRGLSLTPSMATAVDHSIMGPEFEQLLYGKQPPHEPVVLKVKVPIGKVFSEDIPDKINSSVYEFIVFEPIPSNNIEEIPFNKAEKMMLLKHGRDSNKVDRDRGIVSGSDEYINRVLEYKKRKLANKRIIL
jgi:hypothetical protein